MLHNDYTADKLLKGSTGLNQNHHQTRMALQHTFFKSIASLLKNVLEKSRLKDTRCSIVSTPFSFRLGRFESFEMQNKTFFFKMLSWSIHSLKIVNRRSRDSTMGVYHKDFLPEKKEDSLVLRDNGRRKPLTSTIFNVKNIFFENFSHSQRWVDFVIQVLFRIPLVKKTTSEMWYNKLNKLQQFIKSYFLKTAQIICKNKWTTHYKLLSSAMKKGLKCIGKRQI